jgi:carboxyl-terminal processing protease
MTHKLLIVLAVLALSAVSASASPQAKAPTTGKTAIKASPRQKIFDIVWRTVRDSHYDPKMNGVNWVAVRAKYLPLAEQAKDQTAFYGVLNTMLGELKQSHLGAIPPETIRAAADVGTNPTVEGEGGVSGITAQWIENQPVVVRVAAKSAGAEAGIKPGDVIVAINDKPIAPVLEKRLAATPSRHSNEERVVVWATLDGLLTGTVGKPFTLTVKDATDTDKTVTVTPKKSTAKLVTFGALPPIRTELETKTLPGNIGYVRFSIFLLPVSESIKDAIRSFSAKKAPGIIIDLRGNRGGVGAMASGISGVLSDKQFSIGTMKTREFPQSFIAYPQEPTYQGKVAILTDEGSISTSEIMAAGLQEVKRAKVIGRQSAGMVLPSYIIELPDGGRLQYVFADFRTPKGVFLEGRGVTPDIPVTLTRATLAASPSGDPILDAALNYLTTKETVTK